MSNFKQEVVQADLLQFRPRPAPVTNTSYGATNGAMWYDSVLNNFYGVVNGVVTLLGGGSSTGGNILPQRTVTVTGSVTSIDSVILSNSASATTQTINTAGLVNGQLFKFKNINTGTLTITTLSGTIDNSPSIQLTQQYQAVDLQYDGTNFWIF